MLLVAGHVPLFHGLPLEQLSRLAELFSFKVLPAGATLYEAGERRGSCYVVIHGGLHVAGPVT